MVRRPVSAAAPFASSLEEAQRKRLHSAINQDESGIAAVRIDGGKGLLSAVAEGRAEAAAGAQMAVAECGGEPANQKWTMGTDGRISNAATKTCLDVATCQTWITYGSCNATTGGCGGATDMNQKWTLTASGQLQTQLASSKFEFGL